MAAEGLGGDHAIDQLIKDDAVDLLPFGCVRAHPLQPAGGELVRVDVAFGQRRGDTGSTWGNAWCRVLSGQIRKSAPMAVSFLAEESISSATPGQSPRSRQLMYSASEGVCIDTSGWACAPRSCAPSAQMVR
jgi:hypothetical protein